MGMSIWFGVRSSVCQMVIERLDGTYNERNEVGQYPLYNKVAGVVVTGNEDGAHASAETTLFNMTHLGCVVPPNADTVLGGRRGPGAVVPRRRRPGSPLHAADQLVVRPQPAPHGADHARQPDPADRQHAGRDGRGRGPHRIAVPNMLPADPGKPRRGDLMSTAGSERNLSGRSLPHSRLRWRSSRSRPDLPPPPTASASTAASTRSTSPAPSPARACGSSTARGRRSRPSPSGRWAASSSAGSRRARATGCAPPTARSRSGSA